MLYASIYSSPEVGNKPIQVATTQSQFCFKIVVLAGSSIWELPQLESADLHLPTTVTLALLLLLQQAFHA